MGVLVHYRHTFLGTGSSRLPLLKFTLPACALVPLNWIGGEAFNPSVPEHKLYSYARVGKCILTICVLSEDLLRYHRFNTDK